MEKADKMTGKLKIKNPVTGIDEKGKLELSKSSKWSTKARKRQAEMSKIENPVNRGKKKASWNPQNHQSGQPRQGKDKLELSKLSKRSTKARKRQAEMSKIEKTVNEVAGKTSWNSQN